MTGMVISYFFVLLKIIYSYIHSRHCKVPFVHHSTRVFLALASWQHTLIFEHRYNTWYINIGIVQYTNSLRSTWTTWKNPTPSPPPPPPPKIP